MVLLLVGKFQCGGFQGGNMDGPYHYTPYMWPMVASSFLMAVLAFHGWRRRKLPGALPFTLTLLIWSLWAIGATLELAAVARSTKIFWLKFQFFWQGPGAVASLCFVVAYARLSRFLTRRNLTPLLLLLLLGSFLIVTNDAHHWVWTGFEFNGAVHPLCGNAYWGLLSFGYLVALINVPILIWLFIRSPQHRWPVGLILCAQILVRVALVLDTAAVNPFAPMDPVILVSDVLAVVYAIALFGFKMFDPVPLARETVIEQMREGMLVLDTRGVIVDLNSAAERILSAPAIRVRGREAVEFLPVYAEAREQTQRSGVARSEIHLGTGAAARYYALHLSPLKDRRDCPLGELLLLHDITERKQAQAQLMDQQLALAALQERERVARELHDGLGQVLGYVKMQAQAARERLAQGQANGADQDLARLEAVVQDAHADVREYILNSKSWALPEAGLLPALRQYLRRFGETHSIQTKWVPPPEGTDGGLEPTAEAQLFRIVQEALTNARKHAHAGCVQMSLVFNDDRAQIIVQDDGVGFDPGLLATAEGNRFGLGFMRERAEEVGGSVELQSAPGSGTRVIIDLPRGKGKPGRRVR
jgi:PAS domain S-box-containing protein